MPFGWGSSASATAAPPRASAYKPTYVVPYRTRPSCVFFFSICSLTRPRHTARDNVEAQALYNHIRTAALALDSLSRSIPLPFLQNLPPALDIGIESIIGFIAPVIGDAVGLVMGLYIVFCCFLFGNLSTYILGQMVRHLALSASGARADEATQLLNVIIDAVIGIVPFIGDVLDVAFKSNVRNLRLLESHLSKSQKKVRLSRLLFAPDCRSLQWHRAALWSSSHPLTKRSSRTRRHRARVPAAGLVPRSAVAAVARVRRAVAGSAACSAASTGARLRSSRACSPSAAAGRRRGVERCYVQARTVESRL
jgi:hypothetical protein